MDHRVGLGPHGEAWTRDIALPSRGGVMAALDMGPQDRPIDVLFCHANGFNGRTYRTVLQPLTDRFRVVAADLRGHGATTLPANTEGRENWHDLRDDLVALLETLDQPPLVVAGHSMGGACGLMAAAAAPDRVKALVLFDPVILPRAVVRDYDETLYRDSPMVLAALRRRAVFPSRQAAFEAYRGRGAFASWSDAQVADYVAGGFCDTVDGQVTLACSPQWEASNFTAHRHDPWAAFAATKCSIRILRAATDSTCRLEEDLPMLEALGRIWVETVPGTSHFLPMERPDLVCDALAEAAGKP